MINMSNIPVFTQRKRKGAAKHLTIADTDEIMQLYVDGWPISKIALHIETSDTRVRDIVKPIQPTADQLAEIKRANYANYKAGRNK